MGKVTLRTKEYPVIVYAHKGALILTTLHYAYEVTNPGDMEDLAALKKPPKKEMELAEKIIKELSGEFDITDYKDGYRERMEKLIEMKMKGEVIVAEVPKKEEVKELMVALQETIKQLAQ